MGRDVIIACDFSSKRETLDFLEKFGELRPFVKIGMELYYAEGPDMVKELKARGHKVFVDLKVMTYLYCGKCDESLRWTRRRHCQCTWQLEQRG